MISFCLSCSGNDQVQPGVSKINSLTAVDQVKKQEGRPQEASDISNKEEILLEYKNDTLTQTMSVEYLNNKKIKFSFVSFNTLRSKRSNLQGLATMDESNADPEQDETEDGTAFFYDDWHYVNGSCQLDMRISDSATYIRVFDFKCDNLHEKVCPIATPGVMHRINKK